MGIRETLGMGSQASWTYVGEYLRDQYIKNTDDIVRRDEAKKRESYYEGQGDEHIKRLIWLAFEDDLTRKLRGDLVGQAKWNNVLRRVARELGTVYNKPAKRRVGQGEEQYRKLVKRTKMDAVMREVDRKLTIHGDLWIQYRVRKETREPVVDVVTPAMFWAVSHPNDQTQLMAIVLDQTPPRVTRITPCYRVWTADETFQLDAECRVIVSSVEKNEIGRLPGTLASLRPASAKGQLLEDSPAADLVAAHEMIWFQNVLLVKESKSSNRQTYATGDVSSATLGQSADTERETILPEGVTVQAVDRGMDLAQFRENADHALERAGANHGLPPSVLHHRDASSGSEIHLRRIPLRELRDERILILRDVENEVAEVQSEINKNDLPEYNFSAEDWGINFGEVQQPLTETERDAVFEKRRQLGLTNTVDEIKDRDPDLDDEQATAVLKANVDVETERVKYMRELQALSGAMGASTEDVAAGGKRPFEANRGAPQDKDEKTDDEAA
jgi:hypothetical protein